MAISVEISQMNNNKSIIGVFYNGRPTYWEAHVVPTKETDPKTGKEQVRLNIKAQSLIRLLLDKYTDATDSTTMADGLHMLKKFFGDDYNSAMQISDMTKDIAKKMAQRKFEETKSKFSL